MAAAGKAGADAPATVVVNGHEVAIDAQAATSWEAFRILRALNSEESDNIEKMDAALRYAQLVSGMDEDALVGLAGGMAAQISDVMEVVAQIIAAASPKN
jgi:hypothetical protein